MKQRFAKCSTVINYKKIVLSENKSKITFINNNQKDIEKVTVDGCAVKKGIKCDYMLIEKSELEHFVELKGSDIDHAIEQLIATFGKLSKCAQTHKKCAYIISTRCPLTSTKIQNEKLKFKNNYNSSLIIKNLVCETII